MTFTNLEIVLVKMVSVVCHLAYFITDLRVLRIVVPRCKGVVLLRMRVNSVKYTSIKYLFVFGFPL